LPPQQGEPVEGDEDVPGLPQTTHRLELLQMVPASAHLLPGQQGWPALPQGTQVLDELLQVVPASRQALPDDEDEQHGCPVPPHALQT